MKCINCQKPYEAPGFEYFAGEIDKGPAYWSDQGALCTPKCALAHFQIRHAAGDVIKPSPHPGVPGR